MPFLYSCRHSGDQYRITKLNEHFEVEGNSSYLCTLSECDCPAGVRPMCRHREMLPKFIHRKAIGTEWMYDFDRGGWVQGPQEDEPEPENVVIGPVTFTPMPPLPKGVQMFTLDNPLALHNAIAEAVGEPETMLPAPAKWRRF